MVGSPFHVAATSVDRSRSPVLRGITGGRVGHRVDCASGVPVQVQALRGGVVPSPPQQQRLLDGPSHRGFLLKTLGSASRQRGVGVAPRRAVCLCRVDEARTDAASTSWCPLCAAARARFRQPTHRSNRATQYHVFHRIQGTIRLNFPPESGGLSHPTMFSSLSRFGGGAVRRRPRGPVEGSCLFRRQSPSLSRGGGGIGTDGRRTSAPASSTIR